MHTCIDDPHHFCVYRGCGSSPTNFTIQPLSATFTGSATRRDRTGTEAVEVFAFGLCADVGLVRYIFVNVEKHNRFSREGADVLSEERISLRDAVSGCKLVSPRMRELFPFRFHLFLLQVQPPLVFTAQVCLIFVYV